MILRRVSKNYYKKVLEAAPEHVTKVFFSGYADLCAEDYTPPTPLLQTVPGDHTGKGWWNAEAVSKIMNAKINAEIDSF